MCRIVMLPSLARSPVLEQRIIRRTTTILVDSKFCETFFSEFASQCVDDVNKIIAGMLMLNTAVMSCFEKKKS